MNSDPVNLAQIARMAGVGRAALVHWRRQSPDFPAPVGGTPDSPLFDQAAAQAWTAASPLVKQALQRRRQTLLKDALQGEDLASRRRLDAATPPPAQVQVWPPSN